MRANAVRWRNPATFAVLVGLVGLFLIGWLGAVVGFFGGLAAARQPRPVFLGAAVALFVAAVLTILERPLRESEIYSFPQQHDLANVAGAIAGVLLLAGAAGLIAQRDQPAPDLLLAEAADTGDSARLPTSTILAILTASLLGAFALSAFGDRDWGAIPVGLATVASILAAVVIALRRRWAPAGGHTDG
jgi:hypothetical protein